MSGCISKTYRYDLDVLKGIAIIAVVLYHAGWCKSGYLGVDVFLVLNGYFVVPQIISQIEEGRFHYFSFLEKKIFRLLPLVLLVSGISMTVGYWGMLPGDYRYLSEETIASSTFTNNILQAITTQNYWAAIYHKVLMHNWYIGVLMQFYVVFPLLMMLMRRWMKSALIILALLSLSLYLMPNDTIGNKYYLLHYRFFEIAVGGLVAMKSYAKSTLWSSISLGGILIMIFFGAFTIGERAMPYNLVGGTNTIRESFLPREMLLMLTVIFSTVYLLTSDSGKRFSALSQRSRIIAPLGRMSLSIFLWHQPMFAFYRYFIADEITIGMLAVLLIISLLLSIITYYIIEKRITATKVSRLYLIGLFIAINAFALWIYQKGGIVRDVPELDIRQGVSDPMAFEKYTDRIYQYDKEFASDNSKHKILVIGNSFARDFANILLESPMRDSIQLSYHYAFADCPLSRIRQSDRIYFFGWKHDVPDAVWKNLKLGSDIWGIGTKNHGTSNGIFYKNRYLGEYFTQRTTIHPNYHAVNSLLIDEWQEKYVDLISLTIFPDSTVSVFTLDHQFITYDGKHLTPSGASYYSAMIFK